MSDKTGIEWTRSDDGTAGATWNPVTGCVKVSPGCDHCYAETFAERWRGTPGHHFENGFDVTLRPERLDQPLRWKRPRRIFVNSMSDLFHDAVPDEYIARVFAVMAMASQHTFIILTKRHARMRSFLQDDCRCGSGHVPGIHLRSAMDWAGTTHSPTHVPGVIGGEVYHRREWPLPNVWLGVSAEDQKWADIRIPALLGTPAATRFVSAEPLLGPLDLSPWLGQMWRCRSCGFIQGQHTGSANCFRCGTRNWPLPVIALDWVVAGGESGPGARPMHPDWARSLRDQCQAESVPFFFKQWGAWAPWMTHPEGEDGPGDAFVNPDGTTGRVWFNENLDRPTNYSGAWGGRSAIVSRTGKKAAGRVLDGREWSEFPHSCRTCDGSGVLTVPDADGESAGRQACPDPSHGAGEDLGALLAASSLGSEQALAIRAQAPAGAREHARRVLDGEEGAR